MRIENHILNNWKQLYRHGDISRIAESIQATDTVRQQIGRAIRDGAATEAIIVAVSDYYEKVEQEQREIINRASPY